MLEIIVTGIAVYVITGMAVHIVVQNYVNELTRKLTKQGIHSYDLSLHVYGPVWFGLTVLCIATIFWPITLIAVILKAEWNSSKLTQV